jgi:phenylacetate-coenzyme A ligase PaaK-like adenylate-forming protein
MATKPCGCGSRLPRIERIEGRSAEAFWVQNNNGQHQLLPGVLFHSAMDELQGVREWRAVQTERNVIELQLELFGGEEFAYDVQALVARLHEFGLPAQVRVTVEQVIGLRPDSHTGKYRRLISEVGPPQERLKALCA